MVTWGWGGGGLLLRVMWKNPMFLSNFLLSNPNPRCVPFCCLRGCSCIQQTPPPPSVIGGLFFFYFAQLLEENVSAYPIPHSPSVNWRRSCSRLVVHNTYFSSCDRWSNCFLSLSLLEKLSASTPSRLAEWKSFS